MTRRTNGGRIGGEPGGGVDAAGAVAAVNAWGDWGGEAELVPLPLAGPVPVLYNSMTWTPPAPGTYKISNFLLATATSANTEFASEIRVNGVSQGGPYFSFGIPNGVQSFVGVPFDVFATIPYLVEIYVWQPGGPGTATVLASWLQKERKQ